MAIRIAWHAQPRIVCAKILGDYTLNAMEQLHEHLVEHYLMGAAEPVHILIDVEAMKTFPRQITQLKTAANILFSHPMLGWLIFVGKENQTASFVFSAITQTFGVKFRWEKTLEDAETFLRRNDLSLREAS